MSSNRLTPEEFVLLAIEKLAKEGQQTIHTVYSGMNQGFREYFPDGDPIKTVDEMNRAGKIVFRLARGGAVIGKPGAFKPPTAGSDALKKMGIATRDVKKKRQG